MLKPKKKVEVKQIYKMAQYRRQNISKIFWTFNITFTGLNNPKGFSEGFINLRDYPAFL